MKDLTLIIPSKRESESLPIFLEELKDYKYKRNTKVTTITDKHPCKEGVKNGF